MKAPNRLAILTSLALAGGAPLIVTLEGNTLPPEGVPAPDSPTAVDPAASFAPVGTSEGSAASLAAMHAVYRAGLERGSAR